MSFKELPFESFHNLQLLKDILEHLFFAIKISALILTL